MSKPVIGAAPGTSRPDERPRAPADLTHYEFPPSVTIDRPRGEVYAFWRNFVNLSRFMWGVRRVEAIDASHARWVAGTDQDDELVWETSITEDRPNAVIAWRTVSCSRVIHAGRVELADVAGGRATRVSVAIAYERLSGALGERFAHLFHHNPALQTQQELNRFKRLIELEARRAPH
jgi:uncharacterized membrane protein